VELRLQGEVAWVNRGSEGIGRPLQRFSFEKGLAWQSTTFDPLDGGGFRCDGETGKSILALKGDVTKAGQVQEMSEGGSINNLDALIS